MRTSKARSPDATRRSGLARTLQALERIVDERRRAGDDVLSRKGHPLRHPAKVALLPVSVAPAPATWADRRRTFERVAASLRAGGRFRIDITLDDGGSSSLWWATKNEWLGLIDVAGLEIEALYGGFDKRPLGDDSREYVFVTRRP